MGERSKQGIAGTEHGAWANDGRARKRFLDHPFAAPARADVRRAGLGIGADPGDEHEASDTGSSRLPHKRLRALLVHGLESYAALLHIGRHRVDDSVGPGNSASDRASVTHVNAEEGNPFHAHRTQCAWRLLGMPDCDAHSRSLGGEAPHEALPKEPCATEYADRGHSMAPLYWMRLSAIVERTSMIRIPSNNRFRHASCKTGAIQTSAAGHDKVARTLSLKRFES